MSIILYDKEIKPLNVSNVFLVFFYCTYPQGGEGVILPEKLGGVCDRLPETLTLFQTKSVIFPTLC